MAELSGYKSRVAHQVEAAPDGLNVVAKVVPQGLFDTVKHSTRFMVSDVKTAAGANNEIFYIKNDDHDRVLVVEHVFVYDMTGTAEQVIFSPVTGTAASGTAMTVYNLHVGSSEVAQATVQSGTNITGLTLTGPQLSDYIELQKSAVDILHGIPIVLDENQAAALSCVTGALARTFMVIFSFMELTDL